MYKSPHRCCVCGEVGEADGEDMVWFSVGAETF
jgi:hypothetical protein